MADVRFDAAAIADVTLARDWYEGECAGLGEEFVDSVETAVRRIGLFPSARLSCASRASDDSSWSASPTFCTIGQMTQASLSSRACTWHVARSIEYGACVANKSVQQTPFGRC